MKPLKIALLDTGHEWGGGTNSMLELLRRVDRSRFDITPIFYRDYHKGSGEALSAVLADMGYALRVVPAPRRPWWEKPAKEIARFFGGWARDARASAVLAVEMQTRIRPRAQRLADVLREMNADMLYLNNQPGSNLEGYLAAEMLNLPCVQHCRSEPRLLPAVAAIAQRCGTHFIAVSEGVRAALINGGIAASKTETIHNGIDCHQALPAAQRARLGLSDDSLVIGFIGRLAAVKRVDDLINAFAVLSRKHPGRSLALVVVGEGGEGDRLRALAARLGVAGQVIFTGFHAAPLEAMACFDVLALCSMAEGLPRVALEAMLLEKPVVASDVVGCNEVVAAGETGLLYPCGDVEALARALDALIDNPALRARFGAAGRQRVIARFSIERYVAGVEAALENVWKMRCCSSS